jgi:hypothetical protein
MKFSSLFARRAVERVLAPPELEPGEHVLWEYPPGTPNKRLIFWVHGDNEFRLAVQCRLDAIGQHEPWLTKDQVREIIERIIALAKL